MSELKEHEVLVVNSQNVEMVVSASYFKANPQSLKMVDDNGWENKMDSVAPMNKGSVKPVDTKNKASDHVGDADMTEAEILTKEKAAKK